MTTQKPFTKPAGYLSVAAIAALALSACAPDDVETEDQPTEQPVESPEDDATPDDEALGEAPEETDAPEDPDGTDDTGDEPTDEANGEDDGDAAAAGDHPVYQAVEAVLEEYPDGVITEFEDEGGYQEIFVYDGETEWELEVDSESFEIIDTEDDGIDDDDREKAEAVEIEFAEALQTAEAEGGDEPDQAELDTEDGTVVWEIELQNGTEVYVDVTNGEVVRVD